MLYEHRSHPPKGLTTMRNKLIFLAGFGVGYVLGARAGRERYEQLARTARKVRENPTVQETAGILQAQAGGLVTSAKDTLGHTAVGQKVSHFLGGDSPSRTQPQTTGAHAGSNGLPGTTPPQQL
jgi:hypothetical protein